MDVKMYDYSRFFIDWPMIIDKISALPEHEKCEFAFRSAITLTRCPWPALGAIASDALSAQLQGSSFIFFWHASTMLTQDETAQRRGMSFYNKHQARLVEIMNNHDLESWRALEPLLDALKEEFRGS